MSSLGLTSTQTVGPFFGPALLREDAHCPVLAGPDTPGDRIRIEGRVLDGDGAPVPDALLELWQADASGHYHHPVDRRTEAADPTFSGYGRTGTDDNGCYWFETIKPGAVPFDTQRTQAPHIVLTVMSRGMLNHAVTRIYFDDEPTTSDDPILGYVLPPRRATLLAKREQSDGQVLYRFDIVLQGAGETVFFNL
jgi:protocatechuate 3,4-dioxygenase, alpha subunit